MKKSNRRSLQRINKIVLAGLLTGLGVYANAGELTLTSGQVTVGGATATVASTGLVTKVDNVATTNKGIPNFSFNAVPSNIANGTYSFKIGVVLDDDNSRSRIELYIPKMDITINNNVVTTGQLDTSQQVRVLVNDQGTGAASTDTLINALVTIPSATLIGVTNGAFSFNMGTLLTSIAANNNSIQTILNNITGSAVARHYTYRIVVQQTGTSEVRLGVGSTFAAFPRVQTTCEANTASQSNAVFTLSSNLLAAQFTAAYGLQGQYNVTGAAGSAGSAPSAFTENCAVATGGTTTPVTTVTQETTQLSQTISNIVVPTGEVTTAVVQQIDTAVASGGQLAENTLTLLTSTTAPLPTDTALTSLTTVNQALTLAGTATQQGGTAVNTAAAVDTISDIANALAVVATRTLTTTQVTQINTLALNTLSSATNLVATGASTTQILNIVQASSNILAQAATASGKVVSDAVVTQIKELTAKAVTGVIANLPAAATAGVNLSNQAAVQTLMQSNPVVLKAALSASAALPEGTSITVGSVQFTVAQLIALSLGGGTSTTPALQGGGNFLAATTGYTVTTDSVSGNMTLSSATEKYVAAKPVSRLVSAAVPTGISYLPNGTAVLVGNGVATELAPTAFDSAGFRTAVTAAGFQLTYRDNGTIAIALGSGGDRFSGAFGFDNLGTATSCGAMTITPPTGSPASAGYAFVVNCANGPKQRVTPIADNELFYTTVGNAGLNARTDRNTGIITIATVGRFKPSFFVTPLLAADQTFFNANKNADNVALRARDANGDGRTDYDVISSTGVQVFYGMP